VVNLLLDADALIKLNRAGVLDTIARTFACVVPHEVYREAVVEGISKGYPDAYSLKAIIDGQMTAARPVAAAPDDSGARGGGDRAILSHYGLNPDYVVVSDDRGLLGALTRSGAAPVTPAALIVESSRMGRVSVSEARQALRRIRRIIRQDTYERALMDLED